MSKNRVAWVPDLISNLDSALDGGITKFVIQDTVDPLRKIISIHLDTELPANSWNPLQHIVHSFSNLNDCAVRALRKSKKDIEIDIFIKKRGGPKQDKNPFTYTPKTKPRRKVDYGTE